MRYSSSLKVKVDLEQKKVSLSVRVTENKVEVHILDLSDFDVMVAEYLAQKKSD